VRPVLEFKGDQLTVRANVFFDIRDGGPTIKLSVFNTLINFENSYLNFTMTEEKPLSANSVKSDSACEFALPCIESQILYWCVMLATIIVVSSESDLFATSGLHGNSCVEFDDPQTILNVPRSLHFCGAPISHRDNRTAVSLLQMLDLRGWSSKGAKV
jgi:hypothetical protein